VAAHAVISASARVRLDAAAAFLAGWPPATEVIVVSGTREAADDFCRGVAAARGATFGLHRFTLGQLASRIAASTLAARGVTPATALAADALATRALFELTRAGTLGYLAAIADSPGLPRALAETLGELREAGVAPDRLGTLDAAGPDLAHLGARYASLLESGGLADRAALLAAAATRLRAGDAGGLAPGPLLLLDVPLTTGAERDFVAALVERASAVLATVPSGDARTLALLPGVFARSTTTVAETGVDALARVRRYLFAPEAPAGEADPGVQFFSAPGEAREAVEVARRILDEAARGVAFDEMAIVVRAPDSYWGPIEQALERARVPAWFSRGTRRPDPTGRAFLALLACAADNLSARSFAEYLSLGQVPRRDAAGRPDPEPAPFVVSVDEALAPGQLSLLDLIDRPAAAPAPAAALERTDVRAPWRWELLRSPPRPGPPVVRHAGGGGSAGSARSSPCACASWTTTSPAAARAPRSSATSTPSTTCAASRCRSSTTSPRCPRRRVGGSGSTASLRWRPARCGTPRGSSSCSPISGRWPPSAR
jgi:ATP-dependent helicase/nuclease subunit B